LPFRAGLPESPGVRVLFFVFPIGWLPGSPGGDKKDLLAQTSLNSKGHPKYVGLRRT
jgi:hypothetical protein